MINGATTLTGTTNIQGLYTSTLNIQCLLLKENAELPKRQHPTDAGADLCSVDSLDLYPEETKAVGTGIAVKIPVGFVGLIFNRSSQGKRGIILPNSVGVIDSDYRGELKVLLKNISGDLYKISQGDRIAQLVLVPIQLATFTDCWNDTQRGTGGFGSTGK
jgi:dUTP pyrophosphatase